MILETGTSQPNASMLTVAMMEKLGGDLIRLCDRMEPYGLVDYEVGIWEEEILSGEPVGSLCLCFFFFFS